MAEIRRLSCQNEVKSSADKFFDAFNTKSHLMPMISSQLISDIKLLQGDWEAIGSVRLWYFIAGGKLETIKELRENVDENNKTIVYILFDGEIGKAYKTWKSILSITPNGKGSLVKWTIEYEKQNDDVPEPVKYLDFYTVWTKNVDTYLLNA